MLKSYKIFAGNMIVESDNTKELKMQLNLKLKTLFLMELLEKVLRKIKLKLLMNNLKSCGIQIKIIL